jgi:pyruvate dehydrogenase E2 component (dihydrolipoamide acetyltransferase)
MSEFRLPDLGEGLHEALLVQWHVQPGDLVEEDQLLLTVETAKALVDVPSPCAGLVLSLGAAEEETIRVGQLLVRFEDKSDQPAADSGRPTVSVSVVGRIDEAPANLVSDETFVIGIPARRHSPVSTGSIVAPTGSNTVLVRPALRAFAERLGVTTELDAALDSGVLNADGLGFQDVVALREKSPPETADPAASTPLQGIRRRMAEVSAESRDQVVPVSLFDEVDISHWPDRTDILVRCIRALVGALRAQPMFNAHFNSGTMRLDRIPTIDLGLAVNTADGLLVPVLRDVTGLCEQPGPLRSHIDELVRQARARTLTPAQMSGASITLSNFGTLAGRFATPMIVPPQVAIIGVGRAYQAAVVRDDQVGPGRLLPVSMTFDHRIATGGEAAALLSEILRDLIRPG